MEHYRQWHTLKLESLIFQKHISEKHSTTNSGGLPSQTAQIIKQVMVYKHQEVTLSQDQGQRHKKRKLAIHSGKTFSFCKKHTCLQVGSYNHY